MSDNPQGPETHDVNSAASAIEAMLTDDGDSSAEEQPSGEPTEEVEEVEAATEEDPQTDEDGDDEAEDDGESEEDPEPEPVKLPEKVTVKVDGHEIEVPLEELKAGYSRTADYTRKTMALAEERKQIGYRDEALEQDRSQYQAVLEVWKQQLDASLGQEPEEHLARLRQQNPAEYAARIADRQERERRLSSIMAEQQRLEREDQERRAEYAASTIREETIRLFEAMPEWKDQAVASADREAIVQYAASLGYSPQELAMVTDHRQLIILRDAVKYRQLQKRASTAKPQPKKEAIKTASPGAVTTKPSIKSSEYERDRKAFKKSGRDRDAAKLIERMITG